MLFELEDLFSPPFLVLIASPAIETGLCFLFLEMLASDSGSTFCCQEDTLAKKSVVGEGTEVLRTGTVLDEEDLCKSEDF